MPPRRLQVPAVSKLIKRWSAMVVVVELMERPLPKPSGEGYIEARLLETLGRLVSLSASWRRG
jgi:hypothetical protein